MKKTTVFIMALLLTGSLYSFSEDELGPEYGKMLNLTFPGYITQNLECYNKKPVWSPDGKWIAFIAANDTSIYIVPADGGESRVIYTKEDNYIKDEYHCKITEILFSPDSQKIVFVTSVVDTKFGGLIIKNSNKTISYKNYI